MQRQAMPSGMEHSAIGDEAVYLRIQQLQKGLLQFTDSCYPATPDSLGVLPEAKLHTKIHEVCGWPQTSSQTALPFGIPAGQRIRQGHPVYRPVEKVDRLDRDAVASG